MRPCHGAKSARLFKEILEKATPDQCWIWPMRREPAGYGLVTIRKKRHKAHRVVCRMAHGEPPQEKLDAAHSCGNGHLGCVNPHHLRWATRRENVADAIRHGTMPRGFKHVFAKLNDQQVREIRDLLAQGVRQKDIAARYPVTVAQVCHINTGRRWAHLGR